MTEPDEVLANEETQLVPSPEKISAPACVTGSSEISNLKEVLPPDAKEYVLKVKNCLHTDEKALWSTREVSKPDILPAIALYFALMGHATVFLAAFICALISPFVVLQPHLFTITLTAWLIYSVGYWLIAKGGTQEAPLVVITDKRVLKFHHDSEYVLEREHIGSVFTSETGGKFTLTLRYEGHTRGPDMTFGFQSASDLHSAINLLRPNESTDTVAEEG